jgi:plasmid stabilization system protein ParE
MSHKVRLTLEVERQLRQISDYIAQDSVENARRWRSAMRRRMQSLRDFPERHEIAYAAKDVGRDVRHTFYGVYRILYTIEKDAVVVLSLRHGARKPLTIDDIRRLT